MADWCDVDAYRAEMLRIWLTQERWPWPPVPWVAVMQTATKHAAATGRRCRVRSEPGDRYGRIWMWEEISSV